MLYPCSPGRYSVWTGRRQLLELIVFSWIQFCSVQSSPDEESVQCLHSKRERSFAR